MISADGCNRLHGQKTFITYGEQDLADNVVHLVLACTPGAPEGVKGISLLSNLLEVQMRRDEFVYAVRERRTSQECSLLVNARELLDAVVPLLDEATAARVREIPSYVRLLGTSVRSAARAWACGGTGIPSNTCEFASRGIAHTP